MPIHKPQPISGFPELLPQERAIEQAWLDHIRRVFESYGFVNIETPAVESLDVLGAKGATDKEIYTIQRLHVDPDDQSDARLGLHFDLTVPFARYTAQHFNELVFPFKRYQMQKVWRGERAQEGRYREFYQCDIDVVNPDHLPINFDAEMPLIIDEILQYFDIGAYLINFNNRKILAGYMTAHGITDPDQRMTTQRILDKNDKHAADVIRQMLLDEAKISTDQADACMKLIAIQGALDDVMPALHALGVDNDEFAEGVAELEMVLTLTASAGKRVQANMAIIRGFDYYTGTVYECKLLDYPEFGSVVSGGRYADLAGNYINKSLPGVGISLGLSRLLIKMLKEKRVPLGRVSPTDILVVVPSAERMTLAHDTARILRSKGHNVEVYHQASKLPKQLRYAERKEIPFVWFPPFADDKPHEIKDMATGEQKVVDGGAESWTPH